LRFSYIQDSEVSELNPVSETNPDECCDIGRKRSNLSASPPATNNAAATPLIAVDPSYFRPTEVDLLIGDNAKARQQLGWNPRYNL
jgi:GDP-D-mannose dehydratase